MRNEIKLNFKVPETSYYLSKITESGEKHSRAPLELIQEIRFAVVKALH